MALTNIQKIEYYRKKELIKQVVLDRLRKSGNILTGGKAVNRQISKEFQKATQDYDILVKKNKISPQQAARILERELDKRFNGNYFETKQGIYPGVKKVISRVTGEEVADYVKPKQVPTFKRDIDGVNVVTLNYLKKKFKESLADISSEWRHKKDKESLQRIKLQEMKHLNKFKWKKLPKIQLNKQNGGKYKW